MCPSSIAPYDPKPIYAFGEAFDRAWVVLQARDPFRDFEGACELKTALSQKLMTLTSDGVTDPVKLRECALDSPVAELTPNRRMLCGS